MAIRVPFLSTLGVFQAHAVGTSTMLDSEGNTTHSSNVVMLICNSQGQALCLGKTLWPLSPQGYDLALTL